VKRLLGSIRPEIESDNPVHIARIVSPASRIEDRLGLVHPVGALQRRDLAHALQLFEHRTFIAQTFARNGNRFAQSEARIHQFHKATSDSFVLYGTLITDCANHLVDFCVQSGKRLGYSRQIMRYAIAAICVDPHGKESP
jgi:hypothetical protein